MYTFLRHSCYVILFELWFLYVLLKKVEIVNIILAR